MNTRLFAFVFALLSSLWVFVTPPAFSQDEDEAESEARKTAERFLLVLERNPRKGTALDKVVEFHVDHESLDELITRLREKAEATEFEDAGRAWLVVGLIESSQGDAESAQAALERADELLPKSAVASFSLGHNLMTLNRWPEAATALERAIQRQPAPTDLLDVFQTLGRVQQRLAQGDNIVEVWTRLEKLVPNDPRVPVLIAKTLLDDGHWEAALPRFEALARATKDLYQRSEFELEAVDLRLKLGQFEKALAEADRLLSGLKQDHWLFRETRRRVEEAFLAKDDAAGLIKHYEERLVKQPEDLDAVVRLSRALVSIDRRKDARARLEAGIKLAPTSVELRLELIELLQSDQQFAEAIAQYEQLDRIAPNNPDYIRDWGFLILKGQGTEIRGQEDAEQATRAKNASSVWRKLVEAKPKDAVVAAQVAGLMASAEKSLLGDAAELLRRAIELEPEALSHREQLGEVLDSDGKKDESLAAWRSMAEVPRRNANNLAQLAEVLSRFGYRDETLTTIDAACELDRKSLELRFQQAELRRKWKQFESAMSALAEAAALADTTETFDRVVQVEVKVLSESELLTERIEELQALPADGRRPKSDEPSTIQLADTPAAQQFRLAKYLEAADKLREATVAARKAVELAPRDGVFLQAAARMLTLDSQWLSAVELYERLLKIDKRFRIDSLRSIAELEQKLGRKEKALKAGRELLAAAPGNPESAEFVVDVCLRFGQNAEALQILRRASRQNVADKRLALKLVERLMEDAPTLLTANGGRQPLGPTSEKTNVGGAANTLGGLRPPFASATDEAREVLWRVFEQTAKSDDRIEVVRKLAELSVFPGEFAKLTQRLERYRTDPKLRRDASLALVQVHEQAGDTQQARRELERWLPQAPRDPALLVRMVSLCEAAGDLEAAIAHQQRLADVTRKREADEHLVVLLRRAGRDAEADTLATRWLESERDPVKVLREIDRLLTAAIGPIEKQQLHLALKLVQSSLDRDPHNWEFLVRQAFALAAIGDAEKALVVRSELLKLPLSDDTPSILVPSTTTKASLNDRVERLRRRMRMPELPIVDFGEARRIAIDGRLLVGVHGLHDNRRIGDKHRLRVPHDASDDTELRRAWDEVYFWLSYAGPNEPLFKACLAVQAAAPDDLVADWLAVQSLAFLRREDTASSYGSQPKLTGEPLADAVMDRLVVSLRRLLRHDEVLNWDYDFSLPELLARELQRARQHERLAALLKEMEETSPNPNVLGWLIRHAAERNDADEVQRLLLKYVDTVAATPGIAALPKSEFRPGNPEFVAWWVQQLMIRRATPSEPSPERVLKLLDDVWGPLSHPQLPRRSNGFATRLVYILRNPAGLQPLTVAGSTLTTTQAGSIAQSGQGWIFWRTPERWQPITVDFPTINDELDSAVLRVLYQAHSIATEQKWSAALREHWQTKVAKAEPKSREHFLALLALSCLHVWSNEHEAALPVMRQLFDVTERNAELQNDIAFFFQHREKFAEALELLDRIETNDGALRKEIEQRAVRLAVKTNNVERLRVSAERLFGMKLDPAEEQQLASTLSGLGLHEQAEAIRQRLPQRAGNNLAVLQQAMQERIDSKKIDEACQIAEQIIRRTSPANTLIGSVQQATFGGGQQARVITTTSTARTKALALLGQQGRLGPLIEQAEQQFDRSPQSLKLFGQLAELYGAAGTPEKQTGLLVRLADSDAPDPQFRLTLARALVSAGKAPLAVPHFLFAIERLPNATAQVLFEAEQILSELGHVDELAAIVLKSKLAVNDQQRVELFRRIVQRLEGPPIRAKLIIQLFEKAFREAPDFRPMLAAQLLAVSESVWQQEEMWEIARDLVVPSANQKDVGAFYGIDVTRLHSGKQIDSLMRRTVELAAQLKRLDEFAAIVEAAMKSHPDWRLGGDVTLGMIRLKQGRLDEAKQHWAVLLSNPAEQSSTNQPEDVFRAHVAARQRWEKAIFKEPRRPEDQRVFVFLPCEIGVELARARDFEAAASCYELSPDIETVLEHCRWFGKEPAMQQLAVRIVNRMLAGLDDPAELARQASSPLFVEAAKITAEINQPYVAARLAQAMITRWQLPGANNSDGGTWLEQLEHRFASTRAAIKPEMLPGIVASANERREPRPSDRRGSRVTIDLLTHVTGDSLTNLRLDSPFVPLLKEAAKDKDLWAKWRTGKSAHPPDLALAVLASLTELLALDSPSDQPALSKLVETAKSSLKTERPRTAPASFHPQLGLWLVARECLVREEHRKLGHELAELATESSSLHFDPRFQWAILRERGELALKSGDKELASKLWTRLAVDVLRPRSAEETVPMLLGQQFVWSANWLSTRLHRARDLCRLTLNAEMSDLSLAIFRDTVTFPRPPKRTFKFEPSKTLPIERVILDAAADVDSKHPEYAVFGFMETSTFAEDVLATWDTLEPEWRAKGIAAEAIFATLLECVLPANRPEEVFVFAMSSTVIRREPRPPSLALRLVELAIAEKRINLLTQRLAEREKTATNPLALRLIHLLLARLTNDEQRLDSELTKLARHEWLQPAAQSGRIASQIVWLLAPLTERREPVAKLFEQWIAPVSKAFPRDEHPLADLRRWLAKQHLDQQQTDKAKETIAAHLRHMDQVWSATGAMDGQHLRRLELLAIATDYASAGLSREAIDLLAQVADARWPDRYADENPGPVLAILEAKLKSRPAPERYELWRAWSLPNDGVKSMRMLTGAVAGKSEISNLKSTVFLLVEAAREADRLAELDAFVEEQMKQRPSDRIHVLLALIHFANKAPAVAETLVRQQITLWESQAGKTNSATRTRIWDDWLLSVACSRHESLRELMEQLTQRSEVSARELKDDVLLNLMRK